MIAVWLRLFVSLIIPVRYARPSESEPVASTRVLVRLASMSAPPALELRSTNWAGVIWPDFSALSPYWTPTLSTGSRANPRPAFFSCGCQMDLGSGPKTLIAASSIVHRMPSGLLTGLYRSADVVPAHGSVG